MLFAEMDAGVSVLVILMIGGCWAFYFFVLREKGGEENGGE
jgi:hypothetical protein